MVPSILLTKEKNRFVAYYYDHWLVLVVFSICTIGLLLLASASMSVSDKFYRTPLHFLLRQTVYLTLGMAAILIVKQISLDTWMKISGYLLIASIFLLVLVLVPGIGKSVNGSIRWIRLGIVSFQASEFAKIALIIYIAGYLSRHLDKFRVNMKEFIKPMALLGIICCLLILEPDFGAIVVMVVTTLGMMYLAGARLSQFAFLLLIMLIGLGIMAILSPYRIVRLTSFLNPWDRPFDSGYQLVQALIAFGRGGVFGTGLGNSIQKLFYLPEAHTDFLFAILAEEFGIFGQLIIIGLFVFFILRTFYIGYMAAKIKNYFAAYLAYGIGLIIGFQAIINIGVNVGLFPTKGLTLPFMSYGGSSILFNCIAVAIIFRIYHEITIQTTFTPKSYFLTTKVTKQHKSIKPSIL
jgi:cell division protein FtsW